MEKEIDSSSKTRSKWWVWLILALLLLCLALCCCLIVAGVYYFWLDEDGGIIEPQVIPDISTPPSIATLPGIFPAATPGGGVPVAPVIALELDEDAQPLYGPVSLQRGFSPDPFAIGVEGGGTAYASAYDVPCGFTTPGPTFAFSLGGGAFETFLRVFFSPSEEGIPTMLLLTPDREWICAGYWNAGVSPVVDFDAAPSGDYLVWVGSWTPDVTIHGNLFITGSEAVTP